MDAPPLVLRARPVAWGLAAQHLFDETTRKAACPISDHRGEVNTLLFPHFRGNPKPTVPWPFLVSPELFRWARAEDGRGDERDTSGRFQEKRRVAEGEGGRLKQL